MIEAPKNALEAAIDAFRKASREYREAKDSRERAAREHSRADDRFVDAGNALQKARAQLDAAMDAEVSEVTS